MEVNAVAADMTSAENQANTAETAAQGTVEAKEVAVRVEITDAEKLAIRTLENEYLKAQMEIQRLSTIVQNAQKQFPVLVETYVKKYAIDPAVHVFDAVELVFKRK